MQVRRLYYVILCNLKLDKLQLNDVIQTVPSINI